MKQRKTYRALSLLMILLLAVSAAQAEAATLTVTGSASIQLTPDYAVVSLGVNTQAASVQEAQAQNAAIMSSVLDALRGQNIADEDMQTGHFGVNPVYQDYSSFGSSSAKPLYSVDNTLLITVHHLDSIGAVLDAAMQAGANQSYGLTFDSTRRGEAYDRALTAALENAAHKAALLAESAQRKPGEPISITEQTASYHAGYASAVRMDAGGGTPILSGSLTVEASVEVTYPLQ